MAVASRMARKNYVGTSNPSIGGDGRQKFGEMITPDTVENVILDAATLLGIMPPEEDCILYGVLHKINHECVWSKRKLALTNDTLYLSFEHEANVRDSIPLHEASSFKSKKYGV